MQLFTTVITRAEEWLVVVGDPLTLSSVGSNRGCWIEFIRRCRTLDGFLGSTADEQEYEHSLASAEEMRLVPWLSFFFLHFLAAFYC